MKTKEELIKDFPKSQLNITYDDYQVCLLNIKYSIKIIININYDDFINIKNRHNGFTNININTSDYIDIIHKAYRKAYNEQNREEIEKRWRLSRLRAKLVVKEEIIKTRRKI